MKIISAELLPWDIFFLNVLSLIFLYISPIKIEVKKKNELQFLPEISLIYAISQNFEI